MSGVQDPAGVVTPTKAVPVRHPGRWVAAAVIAVLVAMVIHSFFAEKGYEWSSFRKYLFDRTILHGALTTIELTALAMAVGVVGGVLLAVMRLSGNPVLSATSALYVWFFRGTPVLVQVVIWYNLASLFPHLSIGIPFGPEFATASTNSLISKFTAAVLGLGLNEAAYMAEIVRAAWHAQQPDHETNRAAAGDASHRAAHRQRDDLDAQDLVDRCLHRPGRAVHERAEHHQQHLRHDSTVADCLLLVPGDDVSTDDRAGLPRTPLRQGRITFGAE
jgi:His/Glu/Gln/Arg/opine family amino acid ABC transporter permease subunit